MYAPLWSFVIFCCSRHKTPFKNGVLCGFAVCIYSGIPSNPQKRPLSSAVKQGQYARRPRMVIPRIYKPNARRIVKPSATPCQNVLHKASSTANICAGGCSISTRISQCVHQNIGQCPDASGKIPVANRWCFRLSRAARAGTAAESKILRPALLLPPRAARTLCPCPA